MSHFNNMAVFEYITYGTYIYIYAYLCIHKPHLSVLYGCNSTCFPTNHQGTDVFFTVRWATQLIESLVITASPYKQTLNIFNSILLTASTEKKSNKTLKRHQTKDDASTDSTEKTKDQPAEPLQQLTIRCNVMASIYVT